MGVMRNECDMKTKTKSVEIPPGVDALMTPAQVAAALSISARTLRTKIATGKFPRSESPPGCDPRWRVSTFNRWVKKNYGRDES